VDTMRTFPPIAIVLTATVLLAQPPATVKRPVTDTYHGVAVTDDYRWLENSSDPAVKAWSDAQNLTSRKYLDGLPARAAAYEDLKKLYSQRSVQYSRLKQRGEILFAMKTEPDKEQPALVTLKSANDPASTHTIVDPNQMDAKGTTEIDFYEPSRDGRLVAVSLSHGGSESGDVHVYDIASGRELPVAVTPSISTPLTVSGFDLCSIAASFMLRRICAVEANSARPGIRPAC